MQNSITITNEDAQSRLDVFLAAKLDDHSRGDIIRAIKAGGVLVNDLVVKPHYKLRDNDTITLLQIDAVQEQKLAPNLDVSFDIVDENEHFLVINKASGLQVHPSTRGEKDTLANGLLARYPSIKDVGDDPLRPGIMHRLDKDTSGLMIIAKEQETYEVLKEAFKMRKIEKVYSALAWGCFEEKEGEISVPIARAKSYTKQKVAHGKFGGDAKDAVTQYQVVEERKLKMADNKLEEIVSLVEVRPKTGRMHQIRVHLAHIHHPLVGDTKYCTKNEYDKNLHFFEALPEIAPRTFLLHARKLSFTIYGKQYSFEAPLPDQFSDYLATM